MLPAQPPASPGGSVGRGRTKEMGIPMAPRSHGLASPPAPLLQFLLVLLKGAPQLQEIHIPNIIFFSAGQPREQLGHLQAGRSVFVFWNSAENLFSRRPQECVPNKQKGCWGNWSLGTQEGQHSPGEQDGVSKGWGCGHWASLRCASMATTLRGEGTGLSHHPEEESRGSERSHSQSPARAQTVLRQPLLTSSGSHEANLGHGESYGPEL